MNRSELLRSCSAMVEASLASPRKTGQIGWFSPRIWNPADVIPSRKRLVLAATFSDNPPPLLISSRACKFGKCSGRLQVNRQMAFRLTFQVLTLRAQATTGGGNELENRYGRDLWRSRSINCWGPVVYPPAAPPKALPNVELMISARPGRPKYSSVPLIQLAINASADSAQNNSARKYLPVAPKNPVAWHSSMKIMALYASAKCPNCFRGATLPSMEKTPSETIKRIRQSADSCNFDSKSATKTAFFLSSQPQCRPVTFLYYVQNPPKKLKF